MQSNNNHLALIESNKIFDLEKRVIEKDAQIAVLKFELSLQKHSYELLKESALFLLRV